MAKKIDSIKDKTPETKASVKCPNKQECFTMIISQDGRFLKYCETCNSVISKTN